MTACLLAFGVFVATFSEAFTAPTFLPRRSTRVFLEDRIANRIDQETYREQHEKEYEKRVDEVESRRQRK
jgi:hypothetical protein